MRQTEFQKDEVLDRLAEKGNVAQFVAFRPEGAGVTQSFSRIRGMPSGARFVSPAATIQTLLQLSIGGSINVRSYLPHDHQSKQFVYGLTNVEDAVSAVNKLSLEGLHLIVNETIDVKDGGVSGVVQDGLIEFAPDHTPRAVEREEVASMPFEVGMQLLTIVYGFRPELEARPGLRSEFSIHPSVQGWRRSHTILWEQQESDPIAVEAKMHWPNLFSQHIGDKAFGLLMAHLAGVPVPRTLVLGRRVAPFSFGSATGSAEVWTRTCPKKPLPGRYTTVKGWTDPFALLAAEDPSADAIVSVLRQDAVVAEYSGAAIVQADGALAIEGLAGEGDLFMLGNRSPEDLPAHVRSDVLRAYSILQAQYGPVRFEWVHDGKHAWVVQLHLGATASTATQVVPGDPERWVDFEVSNGLETLRAFLAELPADTGINLVGRFGMTSHIADVLRRAGHPSRTAGS